MTRRRHYPPNVDTPTDPPQGNAPHWLIVRRVRVYPRLILAMFVLGGLIYALTFRGGLDGSGRPPGTDFIAFWSAGRLALDGHAADAWDLSLIGAFQLDVYPGLSGPTQWAYPPTTLPLVMLFGALPYLVAYTAWVVVGLALYLGALSPLLRRKSAYAWPMALAFPGLWLGIPSGQIQFFVAALIGAALVLLPRRPVLAGILIGLLVIKPQLGVLIPLALVAGRQWRAFAAAATTSAVAVVGSTAVFGVSALDIWWSSLGVLGDAIDDGTAPVYKFVTPYMGMRLLGLSEGLSLAAHALMALVTGWVVWMLWRRTHDPFVRGSATVVGTFLTTPYAADYDLAVLAFPIAWMAVLGLQHGWLRGDRNLLVATWILPMVAAPIALLTHVTVVPFLMALLLRQLWVRTSSETDRVDVTQPIVGGRT